MGFFERDRGDFGVESWNSLDLYVEEEWRLPDGAIGKPMGLVLNWWGSRKGHVWLPILQNWHPRVICQIYPFPFSFLATTPFHLPHLIYLFIYLVPIKYSTVNKYEPAFQIGLHLNQKWTFSQSRAKLPFFALPCQRDKDLKSKICSLIF